MQSDVDSRSLGRSEDALGKSVLVRVRPEILALMKAGDAEPVVILGATELGDGTYDMTLMRPEIAVEHDRLRAENTQLLAKWSEADALWIAAKSENERRGAALGAIMTFTQAPHPAPCGTDACLLCLIESMAKDALRVSGRVADHEHTQETVT